MLSRLRCFSVCLPKTAVNGDAITNYLEQYTDYDAWKNVRFDKLLAKGAFEVGASMKAGKLEWILVHSQKGAG